MVGQDYIFIAETDHVLFQDIPNLATETMPAGYKFGYMQPNQGFDRIIKRVWPQVRALRVWRCRIIRRKTDVWMHARLSVRSVWRCSTRYGVLLIHHRELSAVTSKVRA